MSAALSQNSPHVKNLAAYGIHVHELRVVSFWEHRWALKVTLRPFMEKEELKRHVENFLEIEFEASEFAWYRSRTSPDREAIVNFKSFAL